MKTIIGISLLLLSTSAFAFSDCSELKRLSLSDLEQTFYSINSAGTIPDGPTNGCVIAFAKNDDFSAKINKMFASTLNFFWSGKTFDRENGRLTNKVLGMDIASAKVEYAQSVSDGSDIIVLDYSDSDQNIPLTGSIVRKIRDEIKEVAPNTYLGKVYLKMDDVKYKDLHFFFALFPKK